MVRDLPEKTVAEARFFWSEITSGAFDQKTVAGLLLTIRPYVTKGTPTREIGDFVAHCEKDRGEIKDRFEDLRFIVNGQETPTIVIGAETKSLEIFMPVPIKNTCFTDDLKRALDGLQLFDKGEIDSTIDVKADELLLCYLAILHFAKLKVKGKDDVEIKIARLIGFGRPDSHLSLRWFRGTSSQMIIDTRLLPSWCDFSAFELAQTPSVRAVRGPDGLKLRKV